MLAKLKSILHENSLCVLCTEADGKPYCSLMTYLLMEDLSVLYLVSTRESRKYQNLLTNPRVSVLVDTRQKLGTSATEKIISITFEGLFQPLANSEAQNIKANLVKDHGELTEIFNHPDSVVFAIKLKSFLLLDGPVDSYKGSL